MLSALFLCFLSASYCVVVQVRFAVQARVHVPDERFKWLCSTYSPKSEVPAFLDIVDIAGLVK